MRRTSSGPLQHLVPIEWKEFFVATRTPRKCVDAIKPEDMIDAKNVEGFANAPDALPPPGEIVCAHRVPLKKRNAPVLSPFLRELVVFEVWLGGRAPRPIEREFIRTSKDVGAVVTNAKGNVAHQGNAALFRKEFGFAPLFARNPLHITKEILPRGKMRLSILR